MLLCRFSVVLLRLFFVVFCRKALFENGFEPLFLGVFNVVGRLSQVSLLSLALFSYG